MRKFLWVIVLFASTQLYAWEPVQLPYDSITHLVTYQEIVKVDSSINSKALYANARAWIANAFHSAQNVIQMDDKDNAQIIVKGNFSVSTTGLGHFFPQGVMNFTLTLKCKDGKYKYVFNNFNHKGEPGKAYSSDCGPIETDEFTSWLTITKKMWNDIKIMSDSKVKDLIIDLKKSMNIKASDEKW